MRAYNGPTQVTPKQSESNIVAGRDLRHEVAGYTVVRRGTTSHPYLCCIDPDRLGPVEVGKRYHHVDAHRWGPECVCPSLSDALALYRAMQSTIGPECFDREYVLVQVFAVVAPREDRVGWVYDDPRDPPRLLSVQVYRAQVMLCIQEVHMDEAAAALIKSGDTNDS